jgi:RNase P subunit RPR2
VVVAVVSSLALRKFLEVSTVSVKDMPRYRCENCGNKTRFDVVATEKSKSFYHYNLAGELTIENSEVEVFEVESVTCRWCGSTKTVVDESESVSN